MNNIGLDKKATKKLAIQLNELLSNYQIFYMNARGYHWNIKGANFFELHIKFEELYNDLILKIDDIAERVLTLGHTPMHTYKDYLATSEVKVSQDVSNGKDAIKAILETYAILIPMQRGIMNMASATNDEGTSALMSDYIREQEKLVWMYTAYLG